MQPIVSVPAVVIRLPGAAVDSVLREVRLCRRAVRNWPRLSYVPQFQYDCCSKATYAHFLNSLQASVQL